MNLVLFPASAMLVVMILASTAWADGAPGWQRVPWVTAETRAAGIDPGGEGIQWPRALAMDRVDGQFLIWGTDVGGLFRSLDGGRTWEPCNVGYTPRGTAGLAIDPHNPQRVLSVGANSGVSDLHGLYLSTDGAASWKQVLSRRMSGSRDRREQIAFDPNTYDEARGYTTDVYWSRIADDEAKWVEVEPDPALYKSTDGGQTWARLPGTEHLGGGIVRVHPARKGVVYVANFDGLYVSEDGGDAFRQLLEGPVTGLAVSPARPAGLWVSQADRLRYSSDGGGVWEDINVPADAPSPADADDDRQNPSRLIGTFRGLRWIQVSPVDADRLQIDSGEGRWGSSRRFASHDGGQTWHEAAFDDTHTFVPHVRREGLFAMHPIDPDIVFSTGGAWPTMSYDGGRTFQWSGNGLNAVMVGGMMHFNVHDPDIMFVGSQDYNGAVTVDGGRTWRYCNVSGYSWGGFTYGGYAITAERLIVGKSDSWGGDRTLRMSTDGGKTWRDVPEVQWSRRSSYDSSFGDPADPAVAFAAGFRTEDAGETWQQMDGCDGVFTASSESPYRLFGLRRDQEAGVTHVVVSDDHGQTWESLFHHTGSIRDLAFDPGRERVYAAAEETLIVFEHGQQRSIEVPADQLGNRRVTGVAVDPVDPDVVYVAQHQNRYAADNSVSRSTDGGRSWTVLTRREPLEPGVLDGGREAMSVRVHPVTREAWTIGACYGMWKVAPPAGEGAAAR